MLEISPSAASLHFPFACALSFENSHGLTTDNVFEVLAGYDNGKSACFILPKKLSTEDVKQLSTSEANLLLSVTLQDASKGVEYRSSQEMVSKIKEIKCSVIFKRFWEKYGSKLNDKVVTMEVICNKIWLPISEKLSTVYQQFLSGQIQLKKVDKYLKLFDDYNALKSELILLCTYFNGTSNLEQVKKELDKIFDKVKSYRRLFHAHQAAKVILELQQKMSLNGDFSEVEGIKEVRHGIIVMSVQSFYIYSGYFNHLRL